MYSKKIKAFLATKGISVGDLIRIERSGQAYEGFLMPQSRLGDPDALVIKLGTGYNIGLSFEGSKLTKLESHKQDFGKTKLSPLKFDSSKPKVSLISIGGTIASRVDYKTGGVYAIEKPEEFLHNVPELAGIVNLHKCHIPFTKMSEDMNHKDWQALAKEIVSELNQKDVQGVIVTMGTDTLHYTAAAISFMVQSPGKPVVLTGAQRSPDRGSSDSAMNIICSAYAATSGIAEVGVVMHATGSDNYCHFLRGTKVRKMHASRRDAFQPINSPPLARIYPDGKIEELTSHLPRHQNPAKAEVGYEPKIALVKAYPDSDPKILDWHAKQGYKGIVVEGTGFGHVPTNGPLSWIPTIKRLSKTIPIVITTQAISGRVNTNVYTNLRVLFQETNAIPAEDMHPETAFVKLGWVLAHSKSLGETRKLMVTSLAGEITGRSEALE